MTISEILNIITNGKSIKSWFSSFNDSNQLVKLDDSGKLPAVDGSLLTGLPTEIIWLTDESFRPTVGVTDKAYVSKATGIIYRYDTVSGSYKIIGGGEGTPYMTATGTNTYIVTNASAVTVYPKAIYVTFENANTGSSSLKIDALPTLPIKSNGAELGEGAILSNSAKLMILAEDSSHYQLQNGTFNVVLAPNKVVTTDSDGKMVAQTDWVNPFVGITSVAELDGADWSSGSATKPGTSGEKRFGDTYTYECITENTWKRYPTYDLIVDDIRLPDVADSGGVKSSYQMTILYPNAITPQFAYGLNGKYEYMGSAKGWAYFENKITP